MLQKHTYNILFFGLFCMLVRSQDIAYNDPMETTYAKAHSLAYDGDYKSSKTMLLKVLSENPNNLKARSLLASTYSWNGQYAKARDEFNKITSKERNDRDVWISAIKNELYAKNEATALGLGNKALFYLKNDKEVERLLKIATERVKNKEYPELGWHNQNSTLKRANTSQKKSKEKKDILEKESEIEIVDKLKPKTPADRDIQNNGLTISNSFNVFDQRYDPMIYSSISYKRQTLAGSIIPRINYSNRFGKHGLQYDLDFYPKFSKRFYAYVNYGYSNASIYPNHRLGGDLYVNLPGAIEFSAGGRYLSFEDNNVSIITNSLGHYRGNYYFSLRSYITPQPNSLTGISGSMLVRKYFKDAENYIGINIGVGFSPELQQLATGDEILAETLLYVESQRLRIEYQFTGKRTPNVYSANMGVTRQELVFDSGSFFWGVSAGITYQVKF